MRASHAKTSNLKLLAHGVVLGCMLVTLLASCSLFSTGEAVAHQIQQPRRSLQGSADDLVQPPHLEMMDTPAHGASQVN